MEDILQKKISHVEYECMGNFQLKKKKIYLQLNTQIKS
jgi:hypothetical protein